MAPKADTQRLTRDVQYLYQRLRLILFQFSCLTPIFTLLAAVNQLKDFVKEAVPTLLGAFKSIMRESWGQPRIRTGSGEALSLLTSALEPLGVTNTAAAHFILGATPLALELAEHFIVSNVIGIFRLGQTDNYLLRLRHDFGPLKVSYLLTQFIGGHLRAGTRVERIFQERVQDNKGKGTGKGEKRKGGHKGRGNKGRSRSPRGLRPVGAQMSPQSPPES